MTRSAPLCPLLVLLCASCGPSAIDPGTEGVTVSEARALNEAAEMIEPQKLADQPGLSAAPTKP